MKGNDDGSGRITDEKDTGDTEMQTTTTASSTTRTSSTPAGSTPAGDARPLRILAKSVYRELRASGHSRTDIVGFTNALLELVTSDLRDENGNNA